MAALAQLPRPADEVPPARALTLLPTRERIASNAGHMSSQVSSTPRQGLNARQAETVEKLLAAGAEELRAVGHEGLTVRTVASRAGVSPATAYTYFASKNHLFAELFWRAPRHRARPPSRPGTTAVARLQAVTRHLAEQLAEEPELAAAATHGAARHRPRRRAAPAARSAPSSSTGSAPRSATTPTRRCSRRSCSRSPARCCRPAWA